MALLYRYRLIIAIVGFLAFTALYAQSEKTYLEKHYDKSEHRITMRDGVNLYTVVYSPKNRSTTYPMMLWRTPYSAGPYGENNYRTSRLETWEHLAREKFIFVFQDVRGRFMSGGEYVNMRPHIQVKQNEKDIDESSDTYDTIDWLIDNIPNNNGRAGMWGISYPGFYAAMGAIDAHPALKAVSPQAPISDWFIGDDFHHNGAFNIPLAFNFFSVFGVKREGLVQEWPPRFDHGTPDGYRFFLEMGPLRNANKKYLKNEIAFWNDLMAHPNYDEFWQARRTTQYFHNVKPAVMVVGGWFDSENCYGALETYHSIESKNPDADNYLVMGPWFHGGWVRSDGSHLGNIEFGGLTGEYYKENIELPFFNYYLKDKGSKSFPEAHVFETGGNKWHTFDSWPPAEMGEKQLYLQVDNKLAFSKPATKSIMASDSYISDPATPVPYTAEVTLNMPKPFVVEDQRFASQRPDVLVYESDTLTADLTIAGPIEVELYGMTTGTDCDFIVKLIDVLPGETPDNARTGAKMGHYQMLLRGDVMRSKYRHSYEHPRRMPPGSPVKIAFTMNDVLHTFKKGHRLMVQIQSTWFPYVDLNPQKFINIYQAKEKDFSVAEQTVLRSGKYPTHIRLNTLQ